MYNVFLVLAVCGADKAGAKRTQPPWEPPSGSVDVGLQIFNSLTRRKVSRWVRFL